MTIKKIATTFALVMATLGSVSAASAAEDRSYILATASMGNVLPCWRCVSHAEQSEIGPEISLFFISN